MIVELFFVLFFLLLAGSQGLAGEAGILLAVFLVLAGIWGHIFEETLLDFGAQLWSLLRGKLPRKPVPNWWRAKSVWIDEVGLGSVLSVLYCLGGPCRVAVLGLIAADLVQHFLLFVWNCLVRKEGYFPGLLTAVVIYGSILWHHGLDPLWSLPAALGAAGLALNFLTAAVGARKA